MKFNITILMFLSSAGPATVLAHGSPQSATAISRRHALAARTAEAYSTCAGKVQTRDIASRRGAKTLSFVNAYLAGRGLEPNFEKPVDSAATCVLVPEEIEGPYYVSGELIRSDIREEQTGIDLLLDVQLLDVHTCKPLPNVLVDFWACNSTGVYSGVQDQNTVGLTFLRGLAMSDKDGIVQVLTKVPGWYSGRAQHIHVKAHVNYTISNGLLKGGAVVHTGQLYMNQSILSEINVLPAYAADLNPFTPNAQDFIFAGEANATAGYDPYIQVTYMGKALSDGLLGKITLALDPTKVAPAVDIPGPPGGNFTGLPPGFTGLPTGTPPLSTSGSPPRSTDISIN